MNFSELIQNRYSVRAYKPDAIEKETLDQILQAAVLAPTAANRQPFRIFVIETEKNKDQLRELYGREWLVQAPLVIGIAAVAGEAWTRKDDDKNYAEVDATIAMDHLIMQAADFGIGTCWIAAFNPSVAKLMLDLPNGWEPIAFTPLGYPADSLRPKKRNEIDDIVVYLDE